VEHKFGFRLLLHERFRDIETGKENEGVVKMQFELKPYGKLNNIKIPISGERQRHRKEAKKKA